MSLSDPRTVFGVHSFTPYSRTTSLPFGTALVLANSSFSFAGELVTLFGGSNRFPWDVQDGTITAEIALALKQFEDWMFEVFLGKAPTTVTTPDTDGEVSTLINKKGTSVVAATGIATVAAKSSSEGDLKFTKYVVKAVSATTVDVFAYSNIDFVRGADKVFEDNALKITATPLTITMSSAVEIPGFGLELTGGSGTIAMTTDDTATFEVFPPFTSTMQVTIGATADVFPEFGALMLAQQKGNQEMFEIDALRCKAIGLPIGLAEKAFAEPEVTAQAFYDSTENAVAKIRVVIP